MSLRILHVSPYFGSAWAYGGIPRVATTLAGALANRGHRVTVWTTDAGDERRRLSSDPLDAAVGCDVRRFANGSNRLAYHLQFFTPRGLRRIAARDAAGFDIAHVHGHRHLLEVIGARALRRARVPYVSAPNGTAPRLERRHLLKGVWDALWGDADLARAAAVLAVSDAERRQLHALGVPAPRIRLVPNPIDPGEFTPPPDGARFRRTWAASGEPIVLFLGKLTPRKRVDRLVAAMPRLAHRRARLVVAGNDMGAHAAVRAAVGRSGLASTVFTGLLEGRDRLDALAGADVVVYPTADEAFGLVPLEALLCGTPVVVADGSGCGEIVATLEGGQVVPLDDLDALAGAIDRVLAAPEAWRVRAAAGAGAVRARFSGDAVAARLECLYRELLDR